MHFQNQSLSANHFSHLLNNINDVYAVYNLSTNAYDFLSSNFENLFEKPLEIMSKQGLIWNEIHEEDKNGIQLKLNEAIHTKTSAEFYYRIQLPQGNIKLVLDKIKIEEENNVLRVYRVLTDYTHLENIEKSLIESEKKFRFISDNISDFISILDANGVFTYASPSSVNILGTHPNEIIGKSILELLHPDDVKLFLEDVLKPIVLEQQITRFSYRIINAQNTYCWLESNGKPVIDEDGNTSSIICSSRDVTDKIESESKLKDSEELYRLLSENSNDLIAIHNLQGEFIYASPSSQAILGIPATDLYGKSFTNDLALKPEDKMYIASKFVEINNNPSPQQFIFSTKTPQEEIKILEVWIKPIFNEGSLINIQSSARDVTEREKLLDELKVSLEKEKELNELRNKFVTNASHQFRTPLTVIQSGIEIMEMYVDNLEEEKQTQFKKQFHKIQNEVARLQELMNDVLKIGKGNAGQTQFHPENLDLIEFCKEIIEEKFNRLQPNERKILFSTSGSPVLVSFDPNLLGHAIENILNNGYKYSLKDNLNLDIEFKEHWVSIAITDKGIGIPEDDLKNLFHPFFRASNTDDFEGTGLGLAIVKDFIEKHNGKILIHSKLNKGTTFSVLLPLMK